MQLLHFAHGKKYENAGIAGVCIEDKTFPKQNSLLKEGNNQLLSEKRAKSVLKYLLQLGVDKTRLSSVGYGEENPKYSNDSEIGRSKNRRTELKVLSY